MTAPLRRLADRYVTEVCLALFAGRPVPDWARAALPRLPKVMADTDRVASAAERGAVDLAEAVMLAAGSASASRPWSSTWTSRARRPPPPRLARLGRQAAWSRWTTRPYGPAATVSCRSASASRCAWSPRTRSPAQVLFAHP